MPDKPEQLGIAIVGTGTIANHHARSLSQHAPARMVAIYDILGERAREFAQQWQVPYVAPSLDDVLSRRDVDAVIVATPPYAHMEPTIAALEAGKHVLCEKPFALDPHEAEQMTATAERTGKYLAVCSARQRCGAAMRRAHELCATGRLGEVYHVRSSQFRVRGRPGIDILRDVHWFIDSKRAGGGALIDIGVYQIDALLWLLGNPRVKTVLCANKMGIGDPAPEPLKQDVEDHAVVMFTCENGSSGILEITWSSNISGANTILVFGTKAGLRFGPLTYIEPGRLNPQRAVEERVLRGNIEDGSYAGFGDVSQQFVDAVLAGRQPYTPARDALEVTRVIHAAYESARTGQAVQLS
ncbi:MAG TPA: Gfo/Idh/MocA family oxidoreductase [Chloroflexota bacterium]|nr:Gfo/Idh/MocA family oxidoreductase [Chloroflexota bacterium]